MHDLVWHEKPHFSALPQATRTTGGQLALLTKGSVIAIQVFVFF